MKEIKYSMISVIFTTLLLCAGITVLILHGTEEADAAYTNVSLWHFNELSGDDCIDTGSTPGDNDGELGGGVSSYKPTRISEGTPTLRGLEFGGGSQFYKNDYVDVPDDSSLRGISGDGFYITGKIWIYSDSYTYHAIVDKYKYDSSTGYCYGYTVYLTDGKLRFSIYGGSNGNSNLASSGIMTTGEWIFFEVGYNENLGDDQMYVEWWEDGGSHNLVEKDQNYGPAVYAGTQPIFSIGQRSTGWGGYMPFNGKMDFIQYWDID